MKTLFAAAAGLAACLLLTSCVVDSDQPLSSPDKARADQRLVGVWSHKDGSLLTFTPTHGAWLHAKLDGPPGDNQKPGSYDVFPTTIGDYTFLNVRSSGHDAHGNPTTSYFILRYAISSNHVLHMWMMSQDAAVTAVRSGKLKGHVQATGSKLTNPPRPDYDVTFQDTGVNLTKFIESSDIPALFNDAMNPSQRVSD